MTPYFSLLDTASDIARQLLLVSQLFSSHIGISTVAETTRQVAVMR